MSMAPKLKLAKAKYVEEGMAILDLFTIGRGWGNDVIVSHQLSNKEDRTVKK